MKKSLLLIVCICTVLIGSAQLVTLENASNTYTGTLAETSEIHVGGWLVYNATSQPIDLRCKRIGVQEVPGSANQFCWGTLCSPFGSGVNYSTEIVTLGADESTNSFYANYRPYGNAGQTTIKYCWFDAADESNEFCYDINYCVDALCVVGVDETKPFGKIDQVSPNPIQHTGNISYSFQSYPTSGIMTFYNAVGAVVKQVNINRMFGTVIISADDFENGIYFCNIQNEGKVYETHRLVIAK